MRGAADSRPNAPTLLHVHGAWHGSWCWDRVRSLLAADGWATRVVDLPSAGQEAAGVQEDAREVLRGLEGVEGPVVVVAHSYAGVPVTQVVAEAPGIAHVVHLTAYRLEVGESVLGYHGVAVAPEPRGFRPVPDDPVATFYGDVPQREAEVAVARLVPQSTKSFVEPLTGAGRRAVPSTYVVCERDRALRPALQEDMAGRTAGPVHRLPSHHSPFLSMPGACASLLARIAHDATA
ncbi:alpha/beta fold hydrolase [Actinacidiphila glaucinigra]|uniref:alpha/beta fold hydrolase n=1 Tax=Actinacidiphila glaucinigra TaxID=235986 RepID=UPI0037C9686B